MLERIADGESSNEVSGYIRYRDRLPVREVVYRHLHNVLRDRQSLLFFELHVLGTGDLRLLTGRDHLRVIAGRVLDHCRHNALHIDQHDIHRAGIDCQLLMQEVSYHRRALAHQNLVSRAANAADYDALRALFFGQLQNLRIAACRHYGLRQGRLMAVDHQVHVIFLKDAQVHLAANRFGCSEQNVAEVRGDHRAAPAVAHGRPEAVHQKVLVVGIDAFVSSVQRFHDVVLDAHRNQSLFTPVVDSSLWSAGSRVEELTLLLAELCECLVCQFLGNSVGFFALRVDAPFFGHFDQSFRALDGVALGLSLSGQLQSLSNVVAVIGMRRGACGDLSNQVASHHCCRVCAADTYRVLLAEAAGAHLAYSATKSILAERAALAL